MLAYVHSAGCIFFHGGVFCRHPKCVPAHRVQNVETARTFIPRDYIAHRIIPHMSHVNATRRIREHFQDIVFRATGIVVSGKTLSIFPRCLPEAFSFFERVAVGFIRGRHLAIFLYV